MIDGTCLESFNAKLSKANTSGHKGVIWYKKRKLWMAQIFFKKKAYNLGGFKAIEAAIAVRKEAEKHFIHRF